VYKDKFKKCSLNQSEEISTMAQVELKNTYRNGANKGSEKL
jgi:hypothetical protein